MINLKKWCSGITVGLSVISLLFSQALAASPDSGDLFVGERAELQRSAGISCKASATDDCIAGNIESGDYYNVRIYGDCAIAAYFGRIGDKAASLRKEVATTGTAGKVAAALAPNQLVCVRAAAQINSTDTEYYVMALPMDHGPECKGEDLCLKPKPLPQDFQQAMANCRKDSQSSYAGCPQGWVFAAEMEAYPNGFPQAQ